MIADPDDFAVTTPSASTVATAELSDDQHTVLWFAVEGNILADSVSELPI
jgi:hypothetical protein